LCAEFVPNAKQVMNHIQNSSGDWGLNPKPFVRWVRNFIEGKDAINAAIQDIEDGSVYMNYWK